MKTERLLQILLTITIASTLLNAEGFGSYTYFGLLIFLATSFILCTLVNFTHFKFNKVNLFSIPMFLIFGIFTIYLVCSQIVRSQNLGTYGYLLSLNFIVLSSVIIISHNVKTIYNSIFIIITLLASLESCLCILQFSGIIPSQNNLFAVSGTLVNPNITAMFLAMCTPAIFHTIRNKKSTVTVVSLIFVIIALILLKCRTALFGSVLCGMVFLIFEFKIMSLFNQNRYFKFKFTLLSSIALICLFFILFFSKKESSEGRLLIWQISLGLAKVNPLTGIGYGCFEHEYNLAQSEYFRVHQNSEKAVANSSFEYSAYNEFIQNAVEGGLIGFVLFFITIFYLLFRTYLLARAASRNLIDITLLSAFACFTVMSFFNFTMRAMPVLTLFVLYIGIFTLRDKHLNYSRQVISHSSIFLSKITGMLLLAINILVMYKQIYFFSALRQNEVAKKLIEEKKYTNAAALLNSIQNELNSENSYWINYGEALYKGKQYRDAIEKFNKAALISSNPNIYMYLGSCYQKINKYDSSILYFLIAKNIIPNRLTPNYALMKTYQLVKDTLNAKKYANILLKQTPKGISTEAPMYKRQAFYFLTKTSISKHEDNN
ncbi:MAG: O-antigen ligase family protein [Ferruginibacter sp.]